MKTTAQRKEFLRKKIKEFYKECTDGIDEENDFYDAEYEGKRPYIAEAFITKLFYAIIDFENDN
jgi:hypothetical protein